jgi:hypothetical protein
MNSNRFIIIRFLVLSFIGCDKEEANTDLIDYLKTIPV